MNHKRRHQLLVRFQKREEVRCAPASVVERRRLASRPPGRTRRLARPVATRARRACAELRPAPPQPRRQPGGGTQWPVWPSPPPVSAQPHRRLASCPRASQRPSNLFAFAALQCASARRLGSAPLFRERAVCDRLHASSALPPAPSQRRAASQQGGQRSRAAADAPGAALQRRGRR
eukprot:3615123-Pleurochrysis_carterae.AAC.3